MLRRFIVALAGGGIALSPAACTCVKGAGQDIESASQSSEDAMNGRSFSFRRSR
jgi:predicted small secreted protein